MSKILIVEDNDKNMKLVRDILQHKGHATLEAVTGGDGVRMAIEHQPDLILMDIQLPDIDGIRALQLIREHAALQRHAGAGRDGVGDARRPGTRSPAPASTASSASRSASSPSWKRVERFLAVGPEAAMNAKGPGGGRQPPQREDARGHPCVQRLPGRQGERRQRSPGPGRGGKARHRVARRDDARPRRVLGVRGDSRQPGHGDAAGGDGHRARPAGGARQGRGSGRRRLPVQAGQPARIAGPGAFAAADQGLSRPGAGAGSRTSGVEPHAGAPCRRRRAAGREAQPHEAVPLAADRRTGGRRRRVAQEPSGRDHGGVPGHAGLHGLHRDRRPRRSAAGAARVPRARWAS